jgi:hypothetical protein
LQENLIVNVELEKITGKNYADYEAKKYLAPVL